MISLFHNLFSIVIACLFSVVGHRHPASTSPGHRRPSCNGRHSTPPIITDHRTVTSASRSGTSLYRSDRPPTPFSATVLPDLGGGGTTAVDVRRHQPRPYETDEHRYCDCVTSPRMTVSGSGSGSGRCGTRSTVRLDCKNIYFLRIDKSFANQISRSLRLSDH